MTHLAFLLLFTVSTYAQTNDWQATLSTLEPDDSPLMWDSLSLLVSSSRQDGKPVAEAHVSGVHTGGVTGLFVRTQSEQERLIDLKDNRFSIIVPLAGETTKVHFVAVTQNGAIHKEDVSIFFPDWNEFIAIEKYRPPERGGTHQHHTYTAALGLSSISYQEGSKINHSAISTTVKGSYQRRIVDSQLDLNINAQITPFELTSRSPNTHVRFAEMDCKLGYALTNPSSSWRVSIMAGLGALRMIVTDDAFGLSTFLYLQLVPTIRKTLSQQHAVMGHVKYVRTARGFGLFSWKEKVLTVGASLEIRLKNQHPLIATLEMSDLTLANFRKGLVHLGTTSFSFGYGF